TTLPTVSKPRPPLPGGPYLVLGLARSGEAAALALRARGEEVMACDSGRSEPLTAAAKRLSEAGVEVHLDASGQALAAGAGTLVKSPGVPASAPLVAAARARGLPVLGEMELGWRLLDNEFIAVTGTNGKTTTTEWIGHIHREAGRPVAVGGNVGTAITSLIGSVDPRATVICEVSSFQLEDTEAFAPEVAVLLNLAPDHLDRHGTYAEYTAAKLRIFANQGNDDVAVAHDELEIEDLGGCGRRVWFGTGPEAEVSIRAGQLWWGDQVLMSAQEISLPGAHNRENAMAAAAACLARGIEPEAVTGGLRSFPGVAHRLELVAQRSGVAFVNDSKATNVASTLVALSSYPGAVRLIAGGRGKEQDFAPLAPAVARSCAAVYLIGEAAAELEGVLASTGVALERCGDLETALVTARQQARPGDTVLLSPACASFDQYVDFEARGDHFRALVQAF
ncbi:MAG: UDP-N-acetylmuramoyl-L-alanine--D-glutamate ligase, partial [Actinomycetota bacterium]|nr:UDP-N-acetylmuramoyl-L-alanine--D-glutamate ligase [Actinomycetota bacterium]